MENSVVKESKLPFNLYFLTWRINFTIIRCSASKRNCWIFAKGTWGILGVPRACPVCHHMEWGHRNNGPFHLLDSSAAQNIPPPLSWHWYHPSSSKRSPNLMEKEKKLDFQYGYSMSGAAQHCSVIKIVTWCKAPVLSSTQVLHRSCVLAAWTKSFFIFKQQQKKTFSLQSFKLSE